MDNSFDFTDFEKHMKDEFSKSIDSYKKEKQLTPVEQDLFTMCQNDPQTKYNELLPQLNFVRELRVRTYYLSKYISGEMHISEVGLKMGPVPMTSATALRHLWDTFEDLKSYGAHKPTPAIFGIVFESIQCILLTAGPLVPMLFAKAVNRRNL